jgi:membrane dipeptidase
MMPIFDGHNDTLIHLYLPERGAGRSFFTRSDQGHIDLPRAREGGLAGAFFAIFVPSATGRKLGPPDPSRVTRTENGYEIKLAEPIGFDYASGFTQEVLQSLFRLEEESAGQLKVVRTTQELLDCLERNILAAVVHFEGAETIDPQLHNLEAFYGLGLRSLGITWSRANAFGWGVPFRFPSSPDIGPGLTPAGKELVRACNELGIVLDLAHLNEQGFWDVAKLSVAPLVVSHAGAHAIAPKSRNLTDDQLRAIADSNGVVGVIFAMYDLCSDGRLVGDVPLDAVVRHMAYIAERVGVEHVAFGSDLDGTTISPEIGDVTGLPKVVEALRQAGFDDQALRKVTHENWLRVIGDSWKG